MKVWSSDIIKTKGHWATGTVWNVLSSNKKDSYSIEMSDRGFTCDCPGFTFRGKCKHSQTVNDRVGQAIEGEVPQYYTL